MAVNMTRTVVYQGKGTILDIPPGRKIARVTDGNGHTFSIDANTLILADSALAPLNTEIPLPGPGDAFVNIAAVKPGDAISFGAGPHNYIPVVYTQRPPKPVATPQL